MSINWNNIGAVDGQQEGFEELVCQLAAQEKIDGQLEFVRIGKPDGGKECFWKLKNGSLHFWQAKYFPRSFKSSEWAQVDKSVKTAIDNHKTLSKYYIAAPVDRPDGKGKGKSMLVKWEEKVQEWTRYAEGRGIHLSFDYWGKHELEKRLIKSENEGLVYYFFNQKQFSHDWFYRRNSESINALGGRYTPKLNFELPIARTFEGLAREKTLEEEVRNNFDNCLRQFAKTRLSVKNDEVKDKSQQLESEVNRIHDLYYSLNFVGIEQVAFNLIVSQLEKVQSSVEDLQSLLYELREKEEKVKEAKGENIDVHIRPYHNELSDLQSFSRAVGKLSRFISSPICRLANRPFLIVSGAAGNGKSHLLADVVKTRQKHGHMSLLLLGENFSTKEMPWTQILKNHLRLDINEEVLLGALNAKAQSERNRTVVFIDALNEGQGRHIWPKHLKSFIQSFEPYPWLGLVVSVRDTFTQLITPSEKFGNTVAATIEHRGFEGVEYEASNHFFKHHGIKPPGTPLLNPEFQNPLFLKLFCEGLEMRDLKEIPQGYDGLTTIINYYLDSVEHKLAAPDQLDYDVVLTPLKLAVNRIVDRIVETGVEHVEYREAEQIIRSEFEGKCGSDDHQYLKKLISEGVLNEDLYWDGNSNHYMGVHFAYQRFQDHLIVSRLLDQYLTDTDPKKSFSQGALYEMLENERTVSLNQNLVEALSIQVPERTGIELHKAAPQVEKYVLTGLAFIKGLIWRKPDTVGSEASDYVNTVIVHHDHLFSRFLDVTISMAARPNTHFNADRLHRVLFEQTISERDVWWTTWLQDKYGDDTVNNSVKRLIDWAWNDSDHSIIDGESKRLAAITLGWFLTSSNRYLRDAATKALINLLKDQPTILIEVLKKFEGVNDPYIYERLYAVAFGCALRAKGGNSLKELAEYVYETIFNPQEVYPHILLRDYARSIIEFALYEKVGLKISVERVTPPYKSQLPSSLPTVEEIDAKFKPDDESGHYGNEEWGTTAILRSMSTEYGRGIAQYGDFGRYTFQSALDSWDVDYDGLSNYAIQRIFELGYDPSLFSKFDQNQGSGRAGGSHRERIGKKYQWIAFYEILAKVADNCMMLDESQWGKDKKHINYEGPWNPYVRDIDPTTLIKRTQKVEFGEEPKEHCWWFNLPYENWSTDIESWIRETRDLPNVEHLLVSQDSKGNEWVNLNTTAQWHEPKKMGEDKWDSARRRLSYEIGSWLIPREDFRRMLDSNNSEHVWKDWAPEPRSQYQLFNREFFWSQAWEFFDKSHYYGGTGLPEKIVDPNTEETIAKAFHTVVDFRWEEEFDCSKEEVISFMKPSYVIASGMKYDRKEGAFTDGEGIIKCLDPSVYENGPSSLLIMKSCIQKILQEKDLCLVWFVRGRKQIIGSSVGSRPSVDHEILGTYHLNKSGQLIGNITSHINEF